MKEIKAIRKYVNYKSKTNGFYECLMESKNNLETTKKLDFVDILDVLLSNYFFVKNKYSLCLFRLDIIGECKKIKCRL